MIRALAVSLWVSSLAACQSSLDAPIARDDSCCGAAAPQVVSWNGQPLPPGQGDTAAVYLYDNPDDPTHTWAYRLDGNQLIAIYDIKQEVKTAFIASFMNVCPKPTSKLRATAPPPPATDIICAAIQGPRDPGSGPRRLPAPRMPAYLMYAHEAVQAAQAEVLDQFLSGELCPML